MSFDVWKVVISGLRFPPCFKGFIFWSRGRSSGDLRKQVCYRFSRIRWGGLIQLWRHAIDAADVRRTVGIAVSLGFERQGVALSGSGLVEGEIRHELERGGGITGVVVVCRVIEGQLEHIAYLRTTWRKEYLPLRTWGGRSDRTYRDTDRLLELVRIQFGYRGVIHFYTQGDPVLPSIAHVSEEDLLPFDPARPTT